MTVDIDLREVCVRVGGRAGVRYVIAKFSRMDSLPNFLTHGAPLRARVARARAPLLYQLICRGKTTGHSSAPARWSCDNCQRIFDLDSCQSNHTHTDENITDRLVSSWARSIVTFDIDLHEVCERVGGRSFGTS